ncbi:MAG TPA: hypothetical protein VIH61_08520 [Waddliaceae bacterium]
MDFGTDNRFDDGTTENPEDLTGVTLRHLIETSPKRTLPYKRYKWG